MPTEVERLRDRVEELESLLGLDFIVAPKLALASIEAKILGMLIKRPMMTRRMALSAMYGYAAEDRSDRCVDTPLHYLRKKLEKHGVKISTRSTEGWFLSAAAREKLMPLLESCFELKSDRASLVESAAVTSTWRNNNAQMFGDGRIGIKRPQQ